MDLWFGGRRHDAHIRERFGADLERAARGALDPWAAHPRGALALVIVLDQFSRHIHRGTPAAFAQDPKAQSVVLAGLSAGHDAALQPVERAFFYIPLEHAEDRALQRRSVALHEALVDSVPETHRDRYRDFLHHARIHHDIVERFGRFPHRNRVLGRQSTDAERAFLREGSPYA